MLESLLERFRHRDRLALSRLLTYLSHGEHVAEILAALPAPPQLARTVAVTGSAGVGKSTLVGRIIECVRRAGRSVAVLACDPQSPLTGGALLGDRFRMPAQPDDGVFIRSLATAGGQESVARHVGPMIQLLQAFGFDLIVIETVGAGQGDTAVHGLADLVVLLVQPETGDDLQWEKAGVLEVADLVVVQKADLPGAEALEKQVRAALALSAGRETPVLRVSAKTGEGVEALCTALSAALPQRPSQHRSEEPFLPEAQRQLARWFARAEHEADPDVAHVVREWRRGSLAGPEATLELFRILQARHADRQSEPAAR